MSSAPLAADPKHKGTLACVVLKAKNLPNKRSIGKQDPFAVLSIGDDKKKTKADKRGGQHPQWDEQLHFEIYDDIEDVVSSNSSASGTSSKDSTPSGTIKASAVAAAKKTGGAAGKKILKVACYADDNREPDFIGEGLVDLTGVLKTGEFDEWVTIKAKDRYAGEVYLELTFFSSGPRPRRKKAKAPQAALDSAAGTYGGAGTFSAEIDDADFGGSSDSGPLPPSKSGGGGHPRIPSSMMPANGHGRISTSASTSTMSSSASSSRLPFPHAHSIDEIPSSLRPSSSLAGLATYTPPYAPTTIHRTSSPQPPTGMPSSATLSSLDDRNRRQSIPSSFTRPDVHSMYTSEQHSLGHMPSSSSISQIPSSFSTSSMASVGTIRPNSTQPPPSQISPYEDPINDLIRPLSSMSVGGGYGGAPQHHPAHAASAPPSGGPQPQQPSYAPPPAQQTPWEQSRPPANRVPSSTYGAEPSPYYGGPVAPTPPPQSTSAPPTTSTPHAHQPYHNAGSYDGQSYDRQSYYQQPTPPPLPQATQMVHPAQTFIPTQGSTTNLAAAAAQQPPRPVSPAMQPQQPPLPPPARPLSTGGYHALPPLPGNASYRAPSPAARPQPLPTPPPSAPPPQGSVINAQSLYQPQQRAPSPSPSSQYQHYDGRVPSPAPSAMNHSASQQQMAPYPYGVVGNASRPLPSTDSQRRPSFSGTASVYAQQQQPPPSGYAGQPPPPQHQQQQPADPYHSYSAPPPPGQQGYPAQPPPNQGYAPPQYAPPAQWQQQQQQQQQAPPPHHNHQVSSSSSSTYASPLYHAPAPEQPAYIQSPYDAHAHSATPPQQQHHYQQHQQPPYQGYQGQQQQQGQPYQHQPQAPPQQRAPSGYGQPY